MKRRKMTEETIKERILTLRKTRIFSQASGQLLNQISRKLRVIRLFKGETIISKGDRGDAMYIIDSGRVKVHDKAHVFAHLHPGDVFGEYSLIDTEVRSASVTSLEPTKLFSLNQESFYTLVSNDRKVLQGFLKLMVSRLRELDVIQEELAQKNIQIEKQKAEIEKQKIRAEESEKYKEQFLARMSHEIRTPMHAISGMINILKRNDHPADQEVFLNAMQQSAKHLIVLLNDILDISRIEAGKIQIEEVPIKPREVVDHIIDVLKFKAQQKGLQFEAIVAPDVPQQVMGDPGRLNQVLINLVGNAIKFTDQGHVKVHLSCQEVAGREMLVFQVDDSGIGIPDKHLENIFGLFEQANAQVTGKYGGTGLGLHISKQLVEMFGGTIKAESVEGQGSTFTFTIPFTQVADDIAARLHLTEQEIQEIGQSLSGLRVLVAEDNPFNVMVISDDLTYYIPGVRFDIAENGKIAVAKFKEQDYDLVLMDLQMPEMNGYEATKAIRQYEKALHGGKHHVPVVAMTASLLKAEIDACFRAGMQGYVPKPYQIELFLETIYKELRS